MSDLRRKALGSRSGDAPRSSSRSSSRAASRQNSEDEWSDDASVASIESVESWGAATEVALEKGWDDELKGFVDGLVERKGSSVQGREELLSKIHKVMCLRNARSVLVGREADLLNAVAKSLKGGRTERESLLAARLLSVFVLTCPDYDQTYDATRQILKQQIQSSSFTGVKSASISALSTVIFTHGSSHETVAVLDFLQEIVESDGITVEAADDEGVVTAAIEAFGFLLTGLEEEGEEADQVVREGLPVMVEQLDSAEVNVRVAAGEVIALMYEMWAHADTREEPEEGQELEKPYDDIGHLTNLLSNLSTASSKRIAKSSRRTLHSTFRDVLDTVNNPKYSAPSVTLKFGRAATLYVDSWLKLTRLRQLRRVLSHGMHSHFLHNQVIRDMLEYTGPISSSGGGGGGGGDAEDEDDDDESEEVSKAARELMKRDVRKYRTGHMKQDRKVKAMQQAWGAEDEGEV
ncbi:hypothetical protein YB2330_006489 [Saitoella coloradoensis]